MGRRRFRRMCRRNSCERRDVTAAVQARCRRPKTRAVDRLYPGSTALREADIPSGSLLLSELVGALSHALDITEGQPPGHCVRCCWIGMHDRPRTRPDRAEALRDLYYTLLLKDLGCSSNAARICELYLADDLSFKHDFKTVDGALPQILRFVFRHTGLQAGLAERFRALVNIVSNGGEIATRADRDPLPARRRDRAPDALLRGRGARHPQTSTSTGTAAASRRPARRRTFRSLPASRCWPRSSTCSRSADGPRGGGRAKCESASGAWFDPDMVEAFARIAARRRLLGRRSIPPTSSRRCLRWSRRAQVGSSTTTISTTSPRPSPRSSTRRAPITQRPQRARRAVHRPDRRGAGHAAGRTAPLAQARRAAARHRQARRQQCRARQARQARRRGVGWR